MNDPRERWLSISAFVCTFSNNFQMFGKAMIHHARGKGWFADPRGKPPLLTYGRDLLEFAMKFTLLRSKPATDLAYEATKSMAISTQGDGIMVRAILPEQGGSFSPGLLFIDCMLAVRISPFPEMVLSKKGVSSSCIVSRPTL